MYSSWKCVLMGNPVSINMSLVVYRHDSANNIEYMTIGDGGIPNLVNKSPFEESIPLMVISEITAKELLKSLADCLDERGFKTDSNAKIEGTLEATRGHLEDLRKLLKLK